MTISNLKKSYPDTLKGTELAMAKMDRINPNHGIDWDQDYNGGIYFQSEKGGFYLFDSIKEIQKHMRKGCGQKPDSYLIAKGSRSEWLPRLMERLKEISE